MIPDDEVERVRETADIVTIIGEFVPLKGRGGNYRGPCPFHQGVNRNFSVSAQKKFYHCFVCKESGDVFSFLQKRFGVDWPTAVRMVAEKSGIELHETKAKREGPDPREPLWEANAAAQMYFQRVLWDDPLGVPAREYLVSRAITRDVADRFGLGFAPREIGLMRAYLATLGIDDAVMLDAGLLAKRDETEEPRPRFRARLIFPIHDQSGHIAGFGGRLIAPGEPKYLNTGETPVYTKGKLLYNLYHARNAIRRDERLILVEGYFDVVRLVAAGIETVVAPLGTALTTEQAALVVRYAKNVFVLYDSDQAGLKATFRAGDELLANGATVRVVTLPDGEDPDTFVQKHGRESMERSLKEAIDVFERKVQLLERGGWFADLTRRRAAVDRLLPTIRATRDPVLRDMYIGRASQASLVDRAVLAREADEVPSLTPGRARRSVPTEREAPPSPLVPSRRNDGEHTTSARGSLGPRGRAVATTAEGLLIAAMLHSPAAFERVLERTGEESFRHPALLEIFLALRDAGSVEHVAMVAEGLSADAVEVLDTLLANPDAILDLDRTVEDSLAWLEERRLEDRNKVIGGQMKLATDDEKNALIREKEENARLIRELSALRTSS